MVAAYFVLIGLLLLLLMLGGSPLCCFFICGTWALNPKPEAPVSIVEVEVCVKSICQQAYERQSISELFSSIVGYILPTVVGGLCMAHYCCSLLVQKSQNWSLFFVLFFLHSRYKTKKINIVWFLVWKRVFFFFWFQFWLVFD